MYFLIQNFSERKCREMATNVVVIGPPGAGKGTRIAQAKAVMPNMVSISTGNLLREKGINVSNGDLVSDDIIMELLQEKLTKTKADIIIFDGVPRTVGQAELMKKYEINVDCVVSLPLSEIIAVKRAEDRIMCSNTECQETYTLSSFKPPRKKGVCDKCGADLIKRSDDNAETAKKRLQIYHEETEPLLEYYKSEGIPVRLVFPCDENNIFIHSLIDDLG